MDWHAARRLAQGEPMNILVSGNDLQKGKKNKWQNKKRKSLMFNKRGLNLGH